MPTNHNHNSSSAGQRTVIRGAAIYTSDKDDRAFLKGHVVIEDDLITAVGEGDGDAAGADEVVDGEGFMVLPGFVNPHWHECLSGPYHDAIDDSHIVPSPYSQGGDIAALSGQFGFIAKLPELIGYEEGLAIARWSLWTQLRCGTTALGDIGSANNPMAVGAAAEELGLRLRLSRWSTDVAIAADGSVLKIADPKEQIEALEAIADRYPADRRDVGVLASVMGAFGSSDEQLRLVQQFTQRHGCPVATHLAPLAKEREACEKAFARTPIERFDDAGLLGPNLMAIHTSHASPSEYRRLLATQVNICQSPAHNAYLGERTLSDSRQLSQFIKDGVPFSTSTDGNVLLVGGMAEALRASYLFHNEANGDNTFLKPLTNLRHGTIGGAKALGWSQHIGSIEPGKQADLVMVDCRDWRYFETQHPLEVFIMAGSSQDVDSVWVAGKRLLAEGKSPAFDEREIYQSYQQASQALRARLAG